MDPFPEPATPPLTSRRDFLKLSARTVGLIGLGGITPKLWAKTAGASHTAGPHDTILVLIHLAGGNDGFNTMVPLQNADYYRLRPTLAIHPGQTLKLTENHGLHPSCRGLHALYQQNRLLPILGVNVPCLSHFGAMEMWDQRSKSASDQNTGWLGAFLDQTSHQAKSHPGAIHFSAQLPACLLSVTTPSICSYDTTDPRVPDPLHMSFKQTPVFRPKTAFRSSLFAQNLKKVATLIGSGMRTRIYHLTLSGFDTHSHQAAAHACLLRTLSEAMTAFDQSLEHSGLSDRVLTVAYSEFGRTLHENDRLGTDHGSSAPVLLMGDPANLAMMHQAICAKGQVSAEGHPARQPRQVCDAILGQWLGSPGVPVPS